jgi:hypothetical protein
MYIARPKIYQNTYHLAALTHTYDERALSTFSKLPSLNGTQKPLKKHVENTCVKLTLCQEYFL